MKDRQEKLMYPLLDKDKIIGYTTGVFDLFHIGHLNILKKAKSQCDILIVGVSTDDIVFERKGKYPIVPLSERMAIIEALSCVDYVVVQDNMDKIVALEAYSFNKMFVGSDWRHTETWKRIEEQMAGKNVEVVYFPYTEHTSSTILRATLKKILDS